MMQAKTAHVKPKTQTGVLSRLGLYRPEAPAYTDDRHYRSAGN